MPLATLGALNRGGANPRGLLPQLYLADGCDQSFGDFTPWTEDTCSSLVYTTAVAGEKASHAIKAVKPAMLVMDMPCHGPFKTDKGPAYTSQKLNEFVASWKINHSFVIPYNPQNRAVVERTNRYSDVVVRVTSPEMGQS